MTAVGGALRNSRLLRLVLAYAGSAASEWASWLAVLVYAEDRSGSAAAGWTALALLVPCIVVAPFVGRMANAARPIRTLTIVYGVQMVSLAAAALLARDHAPVVAVAAPAAVAIGGIAFVRPSYAVIAPGLVRTARELTASNLFSGYCDSGAVLLGPVVATAFLHLGGPEAVLALCAGFAVVGVVATATLHRHDRTDAVTQHDDTTTFSDVVRSVRSRRNVPALLGVLATQHLVMGFVGLMFVVLAVDELGMGGSGAGVLNIAFGLGALASTIGATVVSGRRRLAPVVACCLAVTALSLFVLGAVTTVLVALVALPIAGMSRSLLDVTARILLQRSAPPQYLATVFAFIEVLTSVGLAAGTAGAQLAIATVGARTGLMILAGLVAVVMVLTGRQVWQADHAADVPVVAIALLRSSALFSPLPPAALEAAARTAVERPVHDGEVIIREGDLGESYFVVSSGEFVVHKAGEEMRRLTRGHGAGEVALLHDSPRTATVTALGDGVVFEIHREPFLLAVTGHESARDAAWREMERY